MKFLICFSYQETGEIAVEAENEQEAVRKLEKSLEQDGLPLHCDFNLTDREWFVDEYSVVKEQEA